MLKTPYWNETTDDWETLPSIVDPDNNLITFWTNHFSVHDIDVNDLEQARLPTLDGFQVSSFTGAATYGTSFWVPPGPGGQQPSLSLSYNSQTVDSATARTQASWVGMGWSLSAGGYIVRHQNGSPEAIANDTFSIVAGGVGGTMLPIVGGPANTTNYRTVDDSFWRIRYFYDNYADQSKQNTWEAWDKEGNHYYFTYQADYWELSAGCPSDKKTWKWALTKVENKFGNELLYENTKESKTYDLGAPCDSKTSDIAVYLDTITYENGFYRVKFVRATRADYHDDWADADTQIFYETHYLDYILVQHKDGANWDEIRRYDFTYVTTAGDHIYPNHQWWDTNGKTLTLLKVEEIGLGGVDTLPATTFTYADGLHLTKATNGYGGTVDFTYEPTPWSEEDNIEDKSYKQVFNEYYPTICTAADGTADNWEQYGSGDPVACDTWKMVVDDEVKHKVNLANLQPGASYLLKGDVVKNGATDLALGLDYYDDATTNVELVETPLWGENYYVVTLPEDANQLWMYVDCNGCKISEFNLTLLTTRYRVMSRTATDDESGNDVELEYFYDGPATNDATHSDAVATAVANEEEDELYTPMYSSFRGHAFAQRRASDGGTSLTWFHQDDDLTGKAHTTMVGEELYGEMFDEGTDWTNYSAAWQKQGTGGNIKVMELQGDDAIRLNTNSTNWRTVRRYGAGSTLGDGETVVLQFYVGSANDTQAIIGLEQSTPSRFWGIYVQADRDLAARYDTGAGFTDVVLESAWVQEDTWYTLVLMSDDEEMYTLVWETDNPSESTNYRCSTSCSSFANAAWTFEASGLDGLLWVDAYVELKLENMNRSFYAATTGHVTLRTNGQPGQGGGDHDLANVKWIKLEEAINYNFSTESEWEATRTVYKYLKTDQGGTSTEYGNLTREIVKYWDENISNWRNHRGTRYYYYPKDTSTAYLVSLPAGVTVNACSGTGETDCAYNEADIRAHTRYVYDGNTTYNAAPSTGKLAVARTFVCWWESAQNPCDPVHPGGSPGWVFSDIKFEYDNYGNQTKVKTYTGYGDDDTFASTGEDVTETCFGLEADTPGSTCSSTSNSSYHTFPVWTENDKGHTSAYEYDYELGLPIVITDPNENETELAYDNFGRTVKLAYPGDDIDTDPSVTLAYVVGDPYYYVNVTQKLEGSTDFTTAKYYDGLGRLIQTQALDVDIESGACTNCDILVNYSYNAQGRLSEQTVPFAVTASTGHRPTTTSDKTTTIYDALGRGVKVTAPDGTETETSYGLLQTTTTDPEDNSTTTHTNVWGQVVEVHPPADPWTQYTYDELGRLTVVTLKDSSSTLSTTTMTYDLAGRKLEMSDPDMGTWAYTYNAVGSLGTQTDARGCVITFSYDGLQRLTGKTYTGPGACNDTPDVTYEYDYETGGNEGIGLRTYMKSTQGATKTLETTWVYDTRGRVTKETQWLKDIGTFVTSWTYYDNGQVHTMTYPGGPNSEAGETVTSTYNAQGALDSMVGNNTYLDGMEYDAAGRVVARTFQTDELVTAYQYYSWSADNGRLEKLLSGAPDGTPTDLQDLVYTYDNNGNITDITDGMLEDQLQNFIYDDLNRLSTASTSYQGGVGAGDGSGMYEESYTYDSHGRLETMNGGLTTYTYGQQTNCPEATTLEHAVLAVGSSSFCYDKNGNMERRTVQGATLSLTHDAENRLIEASGAAPQTIFADGFESGDLTAWDSAVTDYDDLKVTEHADLEGDFGMRVFLDDQNAVYVRDDTPSAESDYRAAFRFDPNGLTMNTDDNFLLLNVRQESPNRSILKLKLKKPSAGSAYEVGISWLKDGGGAMDNSPWYGLDDEPHLIEVRWVQSTGAGAEDGQVELWLDGILKFSQLDLDTDTLEVDQIRLGAPSGLDTGTSGTFYLDSFTSNTQAAVDHAFLYDGDGKRILGTDGEKETIYLGGYYEYETVDHTGEEIIVLEAGTVTGVTDVPKIVTLSHSFANPVVLAQPLSEVGAEASIVRISGVRSTQFTVELEEPGGGTHPNGETLSYMVFEAGSWEIDLGKEGTLRIEAGLVDTGATVGKLVTNVWESVPFGTAFSTAPAVFTQVQTEYDAGWLTTRQKNVATTGFDMGMEVLDAQTTAHANEVLGWVAVEKNSGTVASHTYEVGATENAVTEAWFTVNFSENHGTTQYFVASIATYDGSSGAHLRYQNLSASSVQVEVEEEVYSNTHTTEVVHYLVLSTTSGDGTLQGTGTRTTVRKYYNGGAMRDGEKMYFMLTDHLGSTSEVVQPEFDTADISNTLVSRVRYTPFGAQRYASAGLPTAKTYTGQYASDIGLMFYNARWYDPSLGRFVQADTIVPDNYNPNAWDRYAYVLNNPIANTDPSGHCPVGIVFAVIFAISAAIGLGGCSTPPPCQSLAVCFEEGKTVEFTPDEQIDTDEFEELVHAVYEDIASEERGRYDLERVNYDTPFYTGGNDEPNVTVCVLGGCFEQAEVNYFAQGMYNAAAGTTLEEAYDDARNWKELIYGHGLSYNDLFWIKYGYEYYLEQQEIEEIEE